MWFKRKPSAKDLQTHSDEIKRLEKLIASLQDQRQLEDKFNSTIVSRLETIETQLPIGRPNDRWPVRTRSVPVFPLHVTPPVSTLEIEHAAQNDTTTDHDAHQSTEAHDDDQPDNGSEFGSATDNKPVCDDNISTSTKSNNEIVVDGDSIPDEEERMSMVSTPAHLVKSGSLRRAITGDFPDEATILGRMMNTRECGESNAEIIPFPDETQMIELMLLFSETVLVPYVVEELTHKEREIDDVVIDLQVACTLSMRIVSAYFTNLNKLVKGAGLPKEAEADFREYTEGKIKANWSAIFTTAMIGHWYDVQFPESVSPELTDFVISLCAWQYLSGAMGSGILKHAFSFNDLGVPTWYDPLEHKALPSQGLGWNLLQPGERCSIIWPGLQKKQHVSRVRAIVVPLLRQHEFYTPPSTLRGENSVQAMTQSLVDLSISPPLDDYLSVSHSTVDIDAITSATTISEPEATKPNLSASGTSDDIFLTAPATPDMGTTQNDHHGNASVPTVRKRKKSTVLGTQPPLTPTTARIRQNTCVYPISWYLQQDEEGIWPELIPVVVPPIPDTELARDQTLFKSSTYMKQHSVTRPTRKYSKVEDRANSEGDWAKMKTIKRARSAVRHGERCHGYREASDQEMSTLLLLRDNEAPSKNTVRGWLSRNTSIGKKKSSKPQAIRGVVHY